MITRLIAASILVIYSLGASAADEQLAFKGLSLGASEQDVLKVYPKATCSGDTSRRDCSILRDTSAPERILSVDCLAKVGDAATCTKAVTPPRLSVGGASLESIHFILFDGRLGSISMRPRAGDFEGVSTAFMDVYGKPQADTTSPITTLGGVVAENRELIWSLQGGRIVLKRYSGNVTESWVSYLSPEGLSRLSDEAESKRRRAAGDL